jgi:LPS export ABC transporter protein LptC
LELPKNKPEFSATGFTAKLYNRQGTLIYSFYAESGNQFPDSNKIKMTKVILRTFAESTGLMQAQITSNDGWLDTKNSLAFLGESVVLLAPHSDPLQVVHVYTNNVLINGTTKIATSSAPVTALQGSSRMSGVGFRLDYTRQLLTIESNVKATYEIK